MKQKLFTKSAFKQAITCQTGLYYYYRSDIYANQNNEDDFLQSLAEGGFQVGELAKVYYGIDASHDIEELSYDRALERTAVLFREDKVNIAEAAFRWENCFIRTDILVKEGHDIKLIEVKAKSWNEAEDSFVTKGDSNCVAGPILEYVYDVAFQKYVLENALKVLYPGENYNVHAYLMMADKLIVSDVDGINQKFIIKADSRGRKRAVRAEGAESLSAAKHVLTPYDVDELCDRIINGQTTEQSALLLGTFKDFVKNSAEAYCNQDRLWTPLGAKCFKCPFRTTEMDDPSMQDGYRECWCHQAGFKPEDFDIPHVKDLWGAFIKRGDFVDQGKYFLSDLKDGDIKDAKTSKPGLSHSERKWLQIGMWTGNQDILKRFAGNIKGNAYLDRDELRQRMESWTFPLHMIDFETSAVALPFYKGMHPYEQVAFQFSHHIIRRKPDGTYSIEHAGQYINVEKGHFPNFDFVRELKRQLEKDNGTIFRYAAHENTILRCIHDQLAESSEPDRQELMDWIDTITTYKEGGHKISGPRNMEDLLEVVKSFYYHKSMKGSNSIKVVLPAVLNSSKFIQDKYSKAIYGSEIKSCTYTPEEAIAWITYEADGKTVQNPYKHLPPVGNYIEVDDSLIDYDCEDEDMTVANGGAALTAYSKLQFSDIVATEALSKALLRYCELDTMSMVFIWEYFYHEIYEIVSRGW